MAQKPHISELTEDDALEAARMCGVQYNAATQTEYGFLCVSNEYDMDFVFVVKPKYTKVIRFGLAGRATDNIHLICRFLEKHYTFD